MQERGRGGWRGWGRGGSRGGRWWGALFNPQLHLTTQ